MSSVSFPYMPLRLGATDDLTTDTTLGSAHSSSPSSTPAASAENREPTEPNAPEASQTTAILPDPNEAGTVQPLHNTSANEPGSQELATTDIGPPQNIGQGADAGDTPLLFHPIVGDLPPPPVHPPPGPENDQENAEQQPGREDDNDQEESSDEEGRPYWAEFAEDTSGPDEQELENIERDNNEVSAVDRTCDCKPPLRLAANMK